MFRLARVVEGRKRYLKGYICRDSASKLVDPRCCDTIAKERYVKQQQEYEAKKKKRYSVENCRKLIQKRMPGSGHYVRECRRVLREAEQQTGFEVGVQPKKE
jgi:hypothetical protein